MGSFDFVTADKFGKKWLDLFGPLALEFGSFLAVSGLDLASWQKVDLTTLVYNAQDTLLLIGVARALGEG